MDPLSATASAIAILQITASIITTCYEYRSRVKSAENEARRITNELNDLRTVIDALFLLLQAEPKNYSQSSILGKLSQRDGPLARCEADLTCLQEKLQPKEGWRAAKAAVFWPLKESDVNKLLLNIERTKSNVQLALAADQRNATAEIQDNIASLAELFSASGLSQRRGAIFQWLSAPNSFSNHAAARKKYQSMTGLWFLRSSQFSYWSKAPNSFFWIHGIPGCGKTVLCSSIVDHLFSRSRASIDTALVYFYFDFNDPEKSNLESVIRSAISQLFVQRQETSKELETLFSKNSGSVLQPPVERFIATLSSMISEFQTVYFVIEALDECSELEELLQAVREIRSGKHEGLHIIASSRILPEVEEFLSNINASKLSVNESAINADISLFIRQNLEKDRQLSRWPIEVREMVERELTGRSHGMFRWVACQLETLRRCLSINDLEKTLYSLPRTLDDTYEQILLRIDETHRPSAFKLLQWLAFAARPVTIYEAAEVVAIDLSGEGCYNTNLKLLDPEDVMLLCSTLVTRKSSWTVDKTAVRPVYDEFPRHEKSPTVIQLAHLSVKDYLTSDRIKQSKVSYFSFNTRLANTYIAQACLLYLLDPAFSLPRCDWETLGRLITNWPLYLYAANFWPLHLQASDSRLDERTWLLLQKFFNTKNVDRPGGNFEAWVRALTPNISSKALRISQPLYYAASFGVTPLIQKLLEANPAQDVDAPGGRFLSSPLQVAGYRGHTAAVRLLLDAKADPMSINALSESCLLWSILRGHHEVEKLLKDSGAYLTKRDSDEADNYGYFTRGLIRGRFRGGASEDSDSSDT